MIIVMKKGAPKEAIAGVEAGLKKRGFTIHESMGVNHLGNCGRYEYFGS